MLSGLPGLELDPAAVRRVLDEPDPVEAGIATAALEARALLGIPGQGAQRACDLRFADVEAAAHLAPARSQRHRR